MPQPSKLLIFQDFQSSILLNGCSLLLPNKQILSIIPVIFQHSSLTYCAYRWSKIKAVFIKFVAFEISGKHFWNIWKIILLLTEYDSALKVAQQITFWGLVAHKPVAYKKMYYVLNLRKTHLIKGNWWECSDDELWAMNLRWSNLVAEGDKSDRRSGNQALLRRWSTIDFFPQKKTFSFFILFKTASFCYMFLKESVLGSFYSKAAVWTL